MAKYTVAYFAGHNEDTWETKGSKGIHTNLIQSGVYEEFNSNIEIASKAVGFLENQEDIKVLFPQKDGRKMTLQDRIEYCNEHNVDIAIFIHSNASSNKNATGAAAFFWYNSSKGLRLAELYAEEMKKKGYPLWSNGTYPCEPGTWSDFYVVANTIMPVILTENFFFTNPDELEKYLLDPNQLTNIAEVHAKATCRYFGLEYKEQSSGGSMAPEKADRFAHEAQEWAMEQGISDGTRPRDPLTRQEYWVMEHRKSKLEK